MAAVTGNVSEKLVSALKNCDPVDLAKSAQLHQIHTMFGSVLARHPELSNAIPRDLTVFFLAMYEANQERLASGVVQLKDIGDNLAAHNIPAVVLKGGADFIDPLHNDPAMRFVADLDILIPSDPF